MRRAVSVNLSLRFNYQTSYLRTVPARQLARIERSNPGPISPFSTTTSVSAKKAKSSPSGKLSKGKGKATEETVENQIDVEGTLEKCRSKMGKVAEWAKGVAFEGVERGRGRVSPGKSS